MADSSLLRSVPLFQAIDPADLERLWQASRVLDVSQSRQIFSQGDPSDAVYAIAGGDGCVRIGSSDRHSKTLMVEVLHAGEVFGEIGVIEAKPRTASAVTEGHVILIRINAAAFRQTLTNSVALSSALSGLLAARLRRTFTLFQDASFETLEVRLARQILYLAERGGRTDARGLRLLRRVRQGDLADLLGATTRSIITILNAWRSAGVIAYDTQRALLTITDRKTLEALVRQDEP